MDWLLSARDGQRAVLGALTTYVLHWPTAPPPPHSQKQREDLSKTWPAQKYQAVKSEGWTERLWRYSRLTWLPTCVSCCREPTLADWLDLLIFRGLFQCLQFCDSVIFHYLSLSYYVVFCRITKIRNSKNAFLPPFFCFLKVLLVYFEESVPALRLEVNWN